SRMSKTIDQMVSINYFRLERSKSDCVWAREREKRHTGNTAEADKGEGRDAAAALELAGGASGLVAGSELSGAAGIDVHWGGGGREGEGEDGHDGAEGRHLDCLV
ncbi:MAG: hypothetical protein M1827_001537, partial [Pycnora praestabilis]